MSHSSKRDRTFSGDRILAKRFSLLSQWEAAMHDDVRMPPNGRVALNLAFKFFNAPFVKETGGFA
jgi:hypothetical protein